MDRPTQRRRGGWSREPNARDNLQSVRFKRRPSAGADGQPSPVVRTMPETQSPTSPSCSNLVQPVWVFGCLGVWVSRPALSACTCITWPSRFTTEGQAVQVKGTPGQPRRRRMRLRLGASHVGPPGPRDGVTTESALVLQPRVALPPTWRSLAFPPTWLRTSMSMTWGSAMPMATAIASVFPVGR